MFVNKEKDLVPDSNFYIKQGDNIITITTDDIFKNKNIVVFSLPGAFTPTCSSNHLPRYNELYLLFKKYGIDAIVCISVNDAFVMDAWKEQQKAQNITFLPDGNADFTKKMGMLVSKENLGFGNRSWRYSMLVKDKIIDKMFIEPEKEGDPFEVSDADTMLKYIYPDYNEKQSVSLFSKPGCIYCIKTKELLREKSYDYEEIVLGHDATIVSMRAITGKTTTPQVFIGGNYIGGYEDIVKYFKE